MNLNPIDFNYIDGENIYPIQEYIDEQIYEKIEYNNVSNTHSSNVRLNNNKKLSQITYYNSCNLYIKNTSVDGEIRFSTNINYPIDTNIDYGTKIDNYGKLLVYHNYNLLQPLYPAGWYNVSDEILQLKADGINTDGQLTLLDAGLLYLTDQNTSLVDKIVDLEAFQKVMTNAYGQGDTYQSFQDILFSGNSPIARAATRQSFNLIKFQSQQKYQNAIGLGVLYGVGIGIGGAVLGYISSRLEQERSSNALYNNSNLSTIDKDDIFDDNIESNVLNISNFNYSMCNLNLDFGFINSNIITTQYINSINTNELKLNNLNISNIFVSSNVASNTSYGFSNDIFSSSNLNFNYTSNSLFSNLQPIYSSSNAVKDIILLDTPRVNKKSAFYCQTTNVIYPNFGNTPYYAYHIDLRNYTQTGYIQIGSQSGDTYRVFNIKCFFGSCYYQRLINGIPDIVDYTIYMSYKASSAGGDTKQGLNILATGIPQSYYLDTITPNRIFLLRNAFNDFNYISVVTTSSADVRVFIEDLLS